MYMPLIFRTDNQKPDFAKNEYVNAHFVMIISFDKTSMIFMYSFTVSWFSVLFTPLELADDGLYESKKI